MPKGKSNKGKSKRRLPRTKPKPTVKGPAVVTATKGTKSIVTRPVIWPTNAGRLPKRVLIKMRYSDNGYTTVAGAYRSHYITLLNSIYDPNNSGTGHQPDLHDALATLYTGYRVSRCFLRWNVRNDTATMVTVGLLATDSNVGVMDSNQIKQRCQCFASLQPTGRDGDQVTLSLPVDIKQLVKAKWPANFSANFGASPSDVVYGFLKISADDGTTNITYTHGFDMLFYLEAYDPVDARAVD